MSQEKISNNDAIEAALQLDGNPENVQAFYESWAQNYNIDTRSVEYSGPAIAADLLQQQQTESDCLDYECRVLDAGCGTGFVGSELKQRGYLQLEGFDLSQSMADQAIESGSYQSVKGGIDMMKAGDSYESGAYDAILSIGVFTLGHVPPEAMQVLVSLTRPNGILVISTRSHYYDQTNFQEVIDQLVSDHIIKIQRVIKDAPYNNDGAGHYWVLKKL